MSFWFSYALVQFQSPPPTVVVSLVFSRVFLRTLEWLLATESICQHSLWIKASHPKRRREDIEGSIPSVGWGVNYLIKFQAVVKRGSFKMLRRSLRWWEKPYSHKAKHLHTSMVKSI